MAAKSFEVQVQENSIIVNFVKEKKEDTSLFYLMSYCDKLAWLSLQHSISRQGL